MDSQTFFRYMNIVTNTNSKLEEESICGLVSKEKHNILSIIRIGKIENGIVYPKTNLDLFPPYLFDNNNNSDSFPLSRFTICTVTGFQKTIFEKIESTFEEDDLYIYPIYNIENFK